MLIELAMSICLQTGLDCPNIAVKSKNLNSAVAGQAVLYASGRTEIHINRKYLQEHKTERKLKELLVHEYAHLITYAQGEIKSPHGKAFRLNCMELAEKANVRKSTCTSHANH